MISVYLLLDLWQRIGFCDIYLIVVDEKARDFLALEAEKN